MATQSPALPIGSWVQYNVTTQSPRAGLPTTDEQTIGKITQSFTAQGGQFYQVVWNPGGANPKTGLYHADQLTCLTQTQANSITSALANGTFTPAIQGVPSSNYNEPNVPVQAAPPSQQQPGMETL